MAETTRKRRDPAPAIRAEEAAPSREWDEAERTLGRAASLVLPLASVLGAIITGMVASLGSGLLVLASGALLGTITLVWVSVRTLSGDAPLAVGFQELAAKRHGVDALSEDKRRVLRALKDLENEHALGKIDDGDYEELVARYRADAKALMRAMDLQVAPLREDAERMARDHLERLGIISRAKRGEQPFSPPLPAAVPERVICAKCRGSNEPDAAFCKQCGEPLDAAETNDASV